MDFGRALAAGLGGGMGATAKVMGAQIISDMEEQKMQRIAEYRSQLHRKDVEWADKRALDQREADNTKVQGAMQGLIGKKFASSDEAAAAAGRGETVAPLTDEQRSSIQMAKDKAGTDPTLYGQAVAQSGVLTPKENVGLLGTIEQRDYARGRDTKEDEFKDRDFGLREKQVNATIASAAQSAADRADARADKAALKEEYALLGHYLTSKATNPKGDYSQQIAASASKIASLGGNPSVMVDLMLGKQTTEKVATKVGDTAMGEQEVTTTKDQLGPRTGGVADAGKPWKNQPTTVAAGTPTGVATTYQGKKGEYAMSKDGKKIFVPYTQQ